MWILKTKEEYKEDQIKKFKQSITGAFFASLFTVFFTTIMSKYGCRGRNPHQYEETWNQVLEGIPADLIMLIFFTIILTLFFYFIGEWKIICDKCSKDKDKIWNDNCSCGGKFIHVKKYKWIKENTDEIETNPVFEEIKNMNWQDFKNKYNLQMKDFDFTGMTLDVPDKYKFTNPNLYLVIKNMLELTQENSYLQIIKKNKSYLQITLNAENNFIIVYHDKNSFLVESSRDLKFNDVIETMNLYYNNYKYFELKYQWVELVHSI